MTRGELGRSALLFLDIDLRLLAVWVQACEVDEWDWELLAPFLRAAYGSPSPCRAWVAFCARQAPRSRD